MILGAVAVVCVFLLLRPILRFFPRYVSHMTVIVLLTLLGVVLHRNTGYSVGQSAATGVVFLVAVLFSNLKGARSRVEAPHDRPQVRARDQQ